MDEARFVFEFVDRSGNTGGGSKSPAGQPAPGSSNTASGFNEAANAAGGAASLAGKNAEAASGKGAASPSTSIPLPASVSSSPAASTKDTTKLFDTAVDLTSAATQAARALSGAPTSVGDVFGRSKSLGEAVSKAIGVTQELLKKPPQVAAPLAVPPIDARVSPLDVMSTSERTRALTDKVLGEAKKSRAESASALQNTTDADSAREAARAMGRAASVQRRIEAGETVKMSAQVAEKAGVVAAEVVKDGAAAAKTVAGVAQVAGTAARAATVAGTGAASTTAGTAAATVTTAAGLGGPLGIALLVGTALASTVPLALGGAASKANSRAAEMQDRMSPFSPQLTQALAQAEIRQMQADIRSANKIGDERARIVTEGSQMGANLQGIGDTLSEPFLEAIGNLTSVATSLTDVAKQGIDTIEPYYDLLIQIITFAPFLKIVAQELEKLRKEREQETSFIDWFAKQPLPAPSGVRSINNPVANVAFTPIPGLNQ